ncbi:MAG TPA: ribosome-associated translation inhibitor RaiA [Vicinamibacterales bacterium]
MRVDITARHMELTAPLRQLVTSRIERLDRVLNDAALSAVVILTREKYRHRTEIAVHTRGDHVLRGNGEANGWALSVRDAVSKIEQQATKLKGKWNERKRKSAGSRVVRTPAPERPAAGPRIIRARRYAVKPMSVEDATLRIEDVAETFVVFRNSETDAVSILYRRKDGNLGLIEPE